jgi:hypothetical protein
MMSANFVNTQIREWITILSPIKWTGSVFNHDEFWEWVRNLSKTNIVYVSEYFAQEDFKCIW